MQIYTVTISNSKSKNVNNFQKNDTYTNRFSDNIWFTRKARIQSEDRLKKQHFHSQLLLVYYTFLAACISIISIKYNHVLGQDTNIIMAIFSIAILVTSLVITTLDFNERSKNFRANYIKLQNIYLRAKAIEKKQEDLTPIQKEYELALSSIENHDKIDDLYARIEAFSTLTSRIPTLKEQRLYKFFKIRYYSFLVIFYTLPFIISSLAFLIKY